jgi:hypothetical protein
LGKLAVIFGLFVLAGLCEIGGGYLVWGWLRESLILPWAILGAVVLVLYGVVATLQPIPEFGWVYARPTAASSSSSPSSGPRYSTVSVRTAMTC